MTMTANVPVPVQGAKRAALLNYFSLFSSFSTLICCALPSVLVLLGMGTTVASLLSAAPWLVGLSRHKIWTFSIAGILIAMSFVRPISSLLACAREKPAMQMTPQRAARSARSAE
jgi:mercuric ion transport protein